MNKNTSTPMKEVDRPTKKTMEKDKSLEKNTPKKRIIVAPWKTIAEFDAVYNWLYSKSSTPACHRKALSQMRIWNLRRGNLCPAAVLATLTLVKAQLQDVDGNEHIQDIYASAFTRFFNFMSSIMQGHNMISMYETARKLGLQTFVVDLRHMCAHGQELPPVDMLRKTIAYCLEWLRDYFWIRQRETMSSITATQLREFYRSPFYKKMTALVELYDLALECHLRGAQKLKAMHKLKSSADFNKLRLFCSAKKMKTTPEILNAVVVDLQKVMKRESSVKRNYLETIVECVFKMEYFFVAGERHKENEELLVATTQEFFRMLSGQCYLEAVFLALIELAENSKADQEKRKGASFWACKLIENFNMLSIMKDLHLAELNRHPELDPIDFSVLNKNVLPERVRKLLIGTGFDQKRTLIFGNAPRKPKHWIFERDFIKERLRSFSEYSAPILIGLLPLANPSFTTGQIEKLTTLCKLQLLNDEPMEIGEELTCDGLEEMVENIKKSTKYGYTQQTKFGVWTLETEHDWSTCPLGVLPWEIESNVNKNLIK